MAESDGENRDSDYDTDEDQSGDETQGNENKVRVICNSKLYC